MGSLVLRGDLSGANLLRRPGWPVPRKPHGARVACAAEAAWGPSGVRVACAAEAAWVGSPHETRRNQNLTREPALVDQGAGSGRPGSRLWSRSGRSLVPAWRRRACRCPPTMVAMAFALRVGLERTASRMKARRGLAGVRRSSAGEVNEVADFLGRGAGGTSTMPAGALPPAHPRSTGPRYAYLGPDTRISVVRYASPEGAVDPVHERDIGPVHLPDGVLDHGTRRASHHGQNVPVRTQLLRSAGIEDASPQRGRNRRPWRQLGGCRWFLGPSLSRCGQCSWRGQRGRCRARCWCRLPCLGRGGRRGSRAHVRPGGRRVGGRRGSPGGGRRVGWPC